LGCFFPVNFPPHFFHYLQYWGLSKFFPKIRSWRRALWIVFSPGLHSPHSFIHAFTHWRAAFQKLPTSRSPLMSKVSPINLGLKDLLCCCCCCFHCVGFFKYERKWAWRRWHL
jgi:hypothetical protein